MSPEYCHLGLWMAQSGRAGPDCVDAIRLGPMSTDGGRPVADLVGVEVAYGVITAAIGGLTDVDAGGSTRLPGWTRGHLLTHIARNADGLARMAHGARSNVIEQQYPDGVEGRERDIEAGAHRPAMELRADVATSHDALLLAWLAMPDDGWDREGLALAGITPVRDTVLWRWRELWVHLVDLDIGFGPELLPSDYRRRDAVWLTAHVRETW